MNAIRFASLALVLFACMAAHGAPLNVCADPNNLPFSDSRAQGFENKLMEMLASDMGRRVHYVWWAQRRGNLRHTLNAGLCDVIPGIASGIGIIGTTRPYYRSSYVFVTRRSRSLQIASLDDPRLHKLTVGVQLVGDNGFNTPPAHALARRGIAGNVRGYMLYGDYAQPHPASAIITAVERGDVDVAIAWGPLAGYFARQQPQALDIRPVTPWLDGPQWPMVFDISMGVRKGDVALRQALDRALEKRRDDIHRLLVDFGVPLIEDPTL